MRLDDLIMEAEINPRTLKDINLENESRMVLKQIKGQAAERVATFIRVGEFLIQERKKQGGGKPKAGEDYYLQAKKKLGLSNIQAKRYTRVAADKRIQMLTRKDIEKLGNYSFQTLQKMVPLNDKEFKEFIENGGKEENIFHKSFTGKPSDVLKKAEKFLSTNDIDKITITLTNSKKTS